MDFIQVCPLCKRNLDFGDVVNNDRFFIGKIVRCYCDRKDIANFAHTQTTSGETITLSLNKDIKIQLELDNNTNKYTLHITSYKHIELEINKDTYDMIASYVSLSSFKELEGKIGAYILLS